LRFTELPVSGSFVIDMDMIHDHRGFFGRVWCERELLAHGLNAEIAQVNVGFSKTKGTLRGLHYQEAPHQEVKVVRCTQGRLYDLVLDLRPDSSTYKRWAGVELTAENRRMLYIPMGCAHGYLTLEDDTEMYYSTSAFYSAPASAGVRYDDPEFGIQWPEEVSVISDKDRAWPFLSGPKQLKLHEVL
jgi:dTDP-4-dehydrorhamnose 3,5-epimerase